MSFPESTIVTSYPVNSLNFFWKSSTDFPGLFNKYDSINSFESVTARTFPFSSTLQKSTLPASRSNFTSVSVILAIFFKSRVLKYSAASEIKSSAIINPPAATAPNAIAGAIESPANGIAAKQETIAPPAKIAYPGFLEAIIFLAFSETVFLAKWFNPGNPSV